MLQRTLKKTYLFEGKGLHTGTYAHMTVGPAPEGTGIRFLRTDIGPDAYVDALAENVSSTSRSTTITSGKASVGTIEHILSALTGLMVDNALIKIDAEEVPILDGSARLYVEAFCADGFQEQKAQRKYIEIGEEMFFEDKKRGTWIRITPADEPSFELTIDFNSKVLGIQTAEWHPGVDYANEVAPCRTFCFLHEIQLMLRLGLVKGGDVENAIVIVENPVSPCVLSMLRRRFGSSDVTVTPEGYLSNLKLRFPDECGRHKLLDIMGDLRLAGGFMKAKVTAFKPGHKFNTNAAKAVRQAIKNN